MPPTVVLIGTLDTKGREYAFVKGCLLASDVIPLVVDFGVLGEPAFMPDVTAEEVARAARARLTDLRFTREGSDTRAVALASMERGLIAILAELRNDGRCDAVMGLAGSGGSTVISGAMRSLPVGIPKLLVSTMASGNVGGYVGTRDLCMMYSVTDVAGLNRVSRKILSNAAAAAAGMARGVPYTTEATERALVAITMFGITTPGVLRLVERLEQAGFDTIVFHATGSGGRAMEEMLSENLIDGVIDYTTSELTDEYLGGIFTAGPHRLEAAGLKGIPQVVVPGALEVLNFGPRATLPEKYNRPERKCIVHNPNVCAVRVNREESVPLGRIFAAKVNMARGPAAVLFPLKGLDKYEQPPNGPWIDAEADSALLDAIRSGLRPDIPITELPYNINDPEFVDATFKTFLRLWEKVSGREVRENV